MSHEEIGVSQYALHQLISALVEELKEAFDLFDTDGSGTLDKLTCQLSR